MKTKDEYLESLQKLKPAVYVHGKKVHPLEEPLLKNVTEAIGFTYEAAFGEYKEFFRAKSHITGKDINIFTHIPQNADDLRKWAEVMKISTSEAGCIFRCVGNDLLRSLCIVTYEIDKKYGSEYHKRFLEYLTYVQEEDLTCAMAMTDAGGSRSIEPTKQPDRDAYVRIVEEKSDGIVIRGCKGPVAVVPLSHEILVAPTRAMGEKEKEFAVSCAIPIDSKGVKIISRPRGLNNYKKTNFRTASSESLIIFDDVFVPHERVFLCGEYDFVFRLVDLFTIFHRHTCGALCKKGFYDLFCGALLCIAEYNGLDPIRVGHIRDKFIDLYTLGEISWALGIAAIYEGSKVDPGVFVPSPVFSNLAKLHTTQTFHTAYRVLLDVASGMPVSIPTPEDYENPEIRSQIIKYLKRNPAVKSENVIKMLWLIEDLLLSSWGARNLILSVHGGGHEQASRRMLLNHIDIKKLKELAEKKANIEK